jgi:hypothetical protein
MNDRGLCAEWSRPDRGYISAEFCSVNRDVGLMGHSKVEVQAEVMSYESGFPTLNLDRSP